MESAARAQPSPVEPTAGCVILGYMVETLTAIAAVIGAVGSVTAGIGVLIVNGKIDRLTGRVDALESTLQTVLTLIAGRPGPTPAQSSGD